VGGAFVTTMSISLISDIFEKAVLSNLLKSAAKIFILAAFIISRFTWVKASLLSSMPRSASRLLQEKISLSAQKSEMSAIARWPENAR